MNSCFKMNRQAKYQTFFMENGRMLLEELIASCNGKCNPIRVYSSEELKRATNNYSHRQVLICDGDYTLYRGYLQDRPISVKQYRDLEHLPLVGSAITDIVIGTQMNNHKNVLKLSGCCLETQNPTLVYEFVGEKTLSNCIYGTDGMKFEPLPWKCRLRIAMDIANAVAYLHTALSRPIIHRDIKPSTILVDQNYVARLIDFSLSISIPEGQSHIEGETIVGRTGHLAPEYCSKGYLTEKVDTYSFGVLLLQLLTGQKSFVTSDGDGFLPSRVNRYMKNNRFTKIVDPTILNEGIQQEQLLTFATLALSCIHNELEHRPMMIDVARELRQIYCSVPPT